jgi:hypothetical protein
MITRGICDGATVKCPEYVHYGILRWGSLAAGVLARVLLRESTPAL